MRANVGASARVYGIVTGVLALAQRTLRRLRPPTALLLTCLLASTAWATSASYYYDELGRLVEAVAADGTSVFYSYDAVGNITSVKHESVTAVGISGFSPANGPAGTTVTIFGSGFNAAAASNVVKFNGVTSSVTSATSTTLVTTVPAAATSGTISVTNGANSATSTPSFTVAASGAPTITNFTPTIGAQGTPVTLSGSNFQSAIVNDKTLFGTLPAPVSAATANAISTLVPSPFSSGKISVTTPFGVATSTNDFFAVPPGIAIENVQTTGRISLNGAAVVSTTTVAGDANLFLFDGIAGSSDYLKLSNVSGNGGAISVFSPSGTLLASGSISNTLIYFPPLPQTGTYTAVISPNSPQVFSISLYSTPLIVIDGAAVTAKSAIPNYGGYFVFQGNAGQNAAIQLTGLSFAGSAVASVFVDVYEPDGTKWHSETCYSSNPNGACNMELPLTQTGRYMIYVTDNGPAIAAGTFSLVSDKAAVLTSDMPYPLTLSAGQNGRFTFSGTAGQPAVISFKNVVTNPVGQNVAVTLLGPDMSTLMTLNGSTASGGAEGNLQSLPSTGTYTVLVAPAFGAATTLTIGLNPPVDLVADTTAANITSAGSNDNVVLTFQGSAGQNLGLQLTGLAFAGSASASVYVDVYEPDGTKWQSETCYSSNPNGACNMELPLTQTGRYEIYVTDRGPAITAGTFTLISDKAAVLTSGTPYPLTLSAGQNGRFTFSGTAGQPAVISFKNVVTNPVGQNVAVTLLGPDMSTLMTLNGSTASGGAEGNLQSLPSTGTYTVLVAPAFGAATTLTIGLNPPVDLVADTTAANITSAGSNDNVVLTFQGSAGQNLGLQLTGLAFAGSASASVYVDVYEPDGTKWQSETCYSSNPNGACNMELPLTQTGRYEIYVTDRGPAITAGTFTLISDKAAVLTSGTPYPLTLSAGQNGRFTFSGTAGQPAVISLKNVVTNPVGQNVAVTLLGPDMSTLMTLNGSTASGGAEGNLQSLPSTGTYTVLVAPAFGAATTLTIGLNPPVDLVADTTAANITSAGSNDNVVLTFQGSAGQNLGLQLTGLAFAGSASASVYVDVYEPDGTKWQSETCYSANPNGACNMELPLTQTGRFQIYVTDNGPAINAGTFTLISDKVTALTLGTPYSLILSAGQNGRLSFTGTAATHSLTVGIPATTPAGQTMTVTVVDSSSNTVASGAYSSAGGVLSLGTLTAAAYTVLVSTASGASATLTLTYQ